MIRAKPRQGARVCGEVEYRRTQRAVADDAYFIFTFGDALQEYLTIIAHNRGFSVCQQGPGACRNRLTLSVMNHHNSAVLLGNFKPGGYPGELCGFDGQLSGATLRIHRQVINIDGELVFRKGNDVR